MSGDLLRVGAFFDLGDLAPASARAEPWLETPGTQAVRSCAELSVAGLFSCCAP